MLLKIGTLDVTPWLKSLDVEYEVLLSSKSGRNARGNNVIDIVNRKDKLICTFAPMSADELKTLLAAVEPYVVSITYQSPKTMQTKTIRAYISTPTVGYLLKTTNSWIMKEFSLNFIEM